MTYEGLKRALKMNIPYLNPKKRITFLKSENIYRVGEQKSTAVSVTDFYKQAPFPNYGDFQTIDDLLLNVEMNPFIKDLKKTVGFGKSFLEVGSGTCQLSLAIASRTNNDVVALDAAATSLELGVEFARNENVENIMFVNADLHDNPIRDEAFDFVWCSGVLHHTESSERGFSDMVRWVKPGGIVIIGLYNRLGRLRTNFRKLIFKLLGKGTFAKKIVFSIDPVLRKQNSEVRKIAWFRDQYLHPVERTHTFDEVLKWFDDNEVEFLGSLPDATTFSGYKKIAEMTGDRGDWLGRFFTQIGMIFSKLGSEGGLFIFVGRK